MNSLKNHPKGGNCSISFEAPKPRDLNPMPQSRPIFLSPESQSSCSKSRRVPSFESRVLSFEIGVLSFAISNFKFRVSNFEFRVASFEFQVASFEFQVSTWAMWPKSHQHKYHTKQACQISLKNTLTGSPPLNDRT